ncbi:hypothetical protein HD806DRAFT_541056 [Xylariaceae sp. AK1471]|nr:hypothetical protein HD806DRAFT_541056 [Xylariaceae sp. AK1471]
MASYSQPLFQPHHHHHEFHNWKVPAHYMQCEPCRDFRREAIRQSNAKARDDARRNALLVGQRWRFRPIKIGSHIRNPYFRALADEENGFVDVALPKQVTIQVPSLYEPVRPDQPVPRHFLGKRSFSSIDDSEPVEYFVPQYFDPQADADYPWAANTGIVGLRSPATRSAAPSPSPSITQNEFHIPGSWPSEADQPNPAPGSSLGIGMQLYRKLNSFNHNLAMWVTSLLRSCCNGVWRTVQRPDATTTTTQPATQPTTQAVEDDGSPSSKRPRLDDRGPAPFRRSSSHLRGSSSYRAPASSRPGPSHLRGPEPFRRSGPNNYAHNLRIRGSRGHTVENESPPVRKPGQPDMGPNFNYRGHFSADMALSPPVRKPGQPDMGPDFNYSGHFSVDMAVGSDDEDDEFPGSPMDIDSPEPIALNQMEAILASQPIESGDTQSTCKSDEHAPIALNKTEAILARQPIDPINVESSPKSDSVAAAARRAAKLFPKSSAVPRARVATPGTPVVETPRHNVSVLATAGHTPMPKKTGKAQYNNILEFFPDDVVHSIPGLEEEQLSADPVKSEHLKRVLMERLRQEQVQKQNAALGRSGLRRPNSTLIHEPSPEWKSKALDAPFNGRFNPAAVHPDAVELKARDFAKLVPETAWLNDDCVHSTLCCLAAYVNKQAGVKPKVDTPKCVAISSLYWSAFCGDHKKLYPRPFSRKWNMTPSNFLDIDTVLVPVNHGAHWTLIVIRPARRSYSYIDSYGGHGRQQLDHAEQWLKLFLGDKFVDDDWKRESFRTPEQSNAYDCGMFVITNAMCMGLGLDPMCYDEGKLPIQRRRIAAMLLNGGFHGEFDLSHL